MITEAEVEAFQRDGAIVLRGLLADWVEVMARGVARNMADPGPYASENAVTEGRFFDDYCNWTRIPEFVEVINRTPALQAAARLIPRHAALTTGRALPGCASEPKFQRSRARIRWTDARCCAGCPVAARRSRRRRPACA